MFNQNQHISIVTPDASSFKLKIQIQIKPFLHDCTSYRFLGAWLKDKSVFWPVLADIIIAGHETLLTFPLVEEQWGGGGPIKQERAVRFY